MSLARQALLVLGVALATLAAWVLYVPAARPWLERAGVLALLGSAGLVPAESAGAAAPARQGSGSAARVVARLPEVRQADAIVTATGSARAIRSVTITPEVEGRVEALGAASGDRVDAGAPLVELDSEAARIAVSRAELLLADARRDLERAQRLSGTGAATTLQRQEAELALRTAELGLRQAQFDLSQRRIVAPVAGWVGILEVEVGDRIGPGAAITRLEDRSSLLVDFRVPERVVGRIRIGDRIEARPLSAEGPGLAAVVSALDNRVDETSRTLRVQATLANEDDRLRPGMALSITLSLPGEPRPAVDPLAIQWGSDGAYVWVVREGRAQRVPVRILQRTADAVLIQATLRPDDRVVVEGVQTLRPNAPVDTGTGTPDAAPARPAPQG